eukprot:3004992-Pyramimonas_sp.AAC.1
MASTPGHRHGDGLSVGELSKILFAVQNYIQEHSRSSWAKKSWGPIGDMILWLGMANWQIRGPL